MPRLSVIVPYRGVDTRLEETVLSVLENRPADTEILVVHDGSYQDPYDLSDEILFIETDRGASIPQMLNAGVMASCAPVIQTLLDGVTVPDSLADEALDALHCSDDMAAVAIPVQSMDRTWFGVRAQSLTEPNLYRCKDFHCRDVAEDVAAPLLSCGVFRRSVLMVLDGFAGSSLPVAELDLAFSLRALGFATGRVKTLASGEIADVQPNATELASLAIEHGIVQRGGWSVVREFVAALSTGPANALAWTKAVQLAKPGDHQRRIEIARQEIHRRREQAQVGQAAFSYRRAA